DDEQRGTGLPKDIPFEDRHADRLRKRGRPREAGPPARPIPSAFHVRVAEIRLVPSDLAPVARLPGGPDPSARRAAALTREQAKNVRGEHGGLMALRAASLASAAPAG